MKTKGRKESGIVHSLLASLHLTGSTGKPVQIGQISSPLGLMVCAADPSGVYLLQFTDQPSLRTSCQKFERHHRCRLASGRNQVIDAVEQQLQSYFNGDLNIFDLPLHLTGTSFQCRVWDQLQRIPHGSTCSYRELATAVQKPSGYRAVAQANAANLISILIPCHRVINTGGALGGYAGGLHRKTHLLDLERESASQV